MKILNSVVKGVVRALILTMLSGLCGADDVDALVAAIRHRPYGLLVAVPGR
jgi:hypothetical protein